MWDVVAAKRVSAIDLPGSSDDIKTARVGLQAFGQLQSSVQNQIKIHDVTGDARRRGPRGLIVCSGNSCEYDWDAGRKVVAMLDDDRKRVRAYHHNCVEPLARMGAIAAQTLLERIEASRDEPKEIAVEPELVVRESTARRQG